MSVTREQLEAAYKEAKRCDRAAVLVGISPTHFKRLMRQHGVPFLPRWEQQGRCRQWRPARSRELAYVLGVLLGDGHVTGKYRDRGNSYRILLSVIDRVFAEKFRDALLALGLCARVGPARLDKRANRKPMYTAMATSKMFAVWYKALSLDDVRAWIAGHEEAFVCGLWESEGHVIPEDNGFDVVIGMSREDIIDLLVEIIASWGLHPRKNGPYKDGRGEQRRDMFRVYLHRHHETRAFIERIDPCIRRSPGQSRAKQDGGSRPGVCRD